MSQRSLHNLLSLNALSALDVLIGLAEHMREFRSEMTSWIDAATARPSFNNRTEFLTNLL
ncbi:hypothetical protein T10_7740 [Trichinella papuae]|uniref:Uncharacterized protein n=1 Tax=Trichinella papuae TaxID=268474 RepID=A0A0V1MEG3_9BILA|nr:hypothetical protein T10_7740 [Trichinella papuae]